MTRTTISLLMLALALASPNLNRPRQFVCVGDSAWYTVRTANSMIGRFKGPVFSFVVVRGKYTIYIVRDRP